MMKFGILLCAILSVIARFFTTYIIINSGQRVILRTKNSISTIRKIKKSASGWEWITSLCFWNVKSERPLGLKFLIIVRVISIIECPLLLLIAILPYLDEAFIDLAICVLKGDSYFETFIIFGIGLYCSLLYREEDKKNKK